MPDVTLEDDDLDANPFVFVITFIALMGSMVALWAFLGWALMEVAQWIA